MIPGDQLLPGIAGIGPYILARKGSFDLPQEGQQHTLVLRLKGITTQQREPVDIVRLKQPKQQKVERLKQLKKNSI